MGFLERLNPHQSLGWTNPLTSRGMSHQVDPHGLPSKISHVFFQWFFRFGSNTWLGYGSKIKIIDNMDGLILFSGGIVGYSKKRWRCPNAGYTDTRSKIRNSNWNNDKPMLCFVLFPTPSLRADLWKATVKFICGPRSSHHVNPRGWALCETEKSFIAFIYPLYPVVNIQKAIEHGPVEIVDLTMKNGGSFHSYVNVYQRVISFISFEYNNNCSYMFIWAWNSYHKIYQILIWTSPKLTYRKRVPLGDPSFPQKKVAPFQASSTIFRQTQMIVSQISDCW